MKRGVQVAALVALAFTAWWFIQARALPPTPEDVSILDRATDLLRDDSVWSKQDTRECSADARSLSLYCALQRASLEVTGTFSHRSAALQEVRYAIERARPGADYAHRLMDFNNAADVTLVDVRAVILDARRALADSLAAGR